MSFGLRPLLLALAALAATGPALAAEPAWPVSPNALPMEALFSYAPEAPNGKLTAPGPYLVSRWGDIVIRGRPEGDRVVSARNIVQCGRGQDPATEVALIGAPPDDVCDGVVALPPGKSQTVAGPQMMLGQPSGWTVIEFAQRIGQASFGAKPPADGADDKSWGLLSTGAVYQNQDGKHVVFAPGETVKMAGDVSFVVKPVMTEAELEELIDRNNAAAMKDLAATLDKLGKETSKVNAKPGGQTRSEPPLWFVILFFAVPLAAIGGAVYGVVRLVKRLRKKR